MRKFLFLPLIFLLISCNNNISISESKSISEIKSEESILSQETSTSVLSSSEISSDSSFFQSSSVEDEITNKYGRKINAFFGDEKIDSNKAFNAFANSSYSFSKEAHTNYSDPSFNKLIDNYTIDSFDSNSWVGFYGNDDVTIDFKIDLNYCPNAFNVHMLQIKSYAIYYPSEVILQASFDGSLYITLGTLLTPSDESDFSSYTYSFNFDYQILASNYRFILKGIASDNFSYGHYKGFMFVDEINGLEYNDDGDFTINSSKYYGVEDYYNYKVSDLTNSLDTSNETYQNLCSLKDVDINIKSYEPIADDYLNENSPISKANILIDNQKANSPNDINKCFAFAMGVGRSIDINLTNIVAINKIIINSIHAPNRNIATPDAFMVSLSLDGINYYKVKREYSDKYKETKASSNDLEILLDKTYQAKYVRLDFVCSYNIYNPYLALISEIEIMGYLKASMGEIVNENLLHITNNSKYHSNILMEPSNDLTVDSYLPILGYIKDGKIIDSNFDAITYCHFNTGNGVSTYEAADEYIKEYLMDGCNTDLIEKAASKINESLKTNKKYGVYYTLYLGEHEQTYNYSLLKYQIDKITKEFQEKNYQNINLAGFYFCEEYLNYNYVSSLVSSLKKINDYIHSLNYESIWCPFNLADGIWDAHNAGFDYTCYQPNYMFNDVSIKRLEATANVCYLYDLCLEIESENISSEYLVNKYYEYLKQGITLNYIEGISMHYAGGASSTIYQAYLNLPKFYEATYLYIKNKLTLDYFKEDIISLSDFTDLNFQCLTDNIISGNLGDLSKLDVKIIRSPLYGSLELSSNGNFTYNSFYSYVGNDYFIINISNSLSYINVKVTINVYD